jgi:predicted 3-demethylubiquinone-9 3-methyltransferase (glyoxalase superfamily)
MKESIYPCIWFDGQAKAAAEFYCPLFKNAKITSENPMVVMFELNGSRFMGLNGGPQFKITPAISFFVWCENIEDTNALWERLIEGGKALIPIDKQAWSERYGWLQDKFGVTWQISVVNKAGDKQKITPSMLFTGKQFGRAKEAIDHYTSIFENAATDNLLPYPAGDTNAGKVMFSEFNLNKYQVIAIDGPGEHNYTFNEGVSFVVNCETQKEIDHYWHKLSEGGAESMCGWLVDKFGVSWQVVPANLGKLMSNPARGNRVMQALLKMKKLDLETLENT